jgi:hypothetical protein
LPIEGAQARGQETPDAGGVEKPVLVRTQQVKKKRRVKPLLSELQVPEWQELAKDRRKWRKMLKSIKIRR